MTNKYLDLLLNTTETMDKCDLILNIDEMKFLFAMESPDTYEIIVSIPCVGNGTLKNLILDSENSNH